MSKRDEFSTFVNEFKATSSTITTEQYRGLHRQAETKYKLSVEEASEILKNSGLNVEKRDNYFEILGLSIEELQSLNEDAIVERVKKAHRKYYVESLSAGARPRPDGRSENDWRELLNQAQATLTNSHKREAYVANLQQEDPLLGSGPPIFKFPNGDEVFNIPQLAKLMLKNSKDATDALYRGYLEQSLGGVGEMHFADAARSVASKFPNSHELGLRAMVSILQGKMEFQKVRNARTPAQLANAIDQNWEEAKNLLFNGFIALWLEYTKQPELANITRNITNHYKNDRDVGVEKVVQSLNPRIGHPKFHISHKSINFGTVDAETQKKIQLQIKNTGRGFLYGNLQLTDDIPGLRLSTKTIRGSTLVTIELDTSHLAYNKKYKTELLVTTNTSSHTPSQSILKAESIVNTNVGGLTGDLTVPISCYAYYPIFKFPNGDEAWNISELAELMSKNSKDATYALYQGDLQQRLGKADEMHFADAARSVVSKFPVNRELGFRAMVSILQEKVKFKKGTEVRTPVQMADSIDQNWEEAKNLLFNDFIELWFKYTKQPELAMIAQEITKDYRATQNIGLEKLVQSLNPQIGHPTLQLSHKSINFGTVDAETQKKIQLRIKNAGRGFLYGSLRLTDDIPGFRLSTRIIRGNADVTIKLDTSHLAFKKKYKTELVITTNAGGDTSSQSILKAESIVNTNVGGLTGDLTVPILRHVDYPIFKFPNGDEAWNILELAELMSKNSKDATYALYQGDLQQRLGKADEIFYANAARSVVNKFSKNRELGFRVMVSILQGKMKFKKGEEAQTPIQLVNSIDQNWEEAKNLLFNDFIELWFKYTKQPELAEIARNITEDYRFERDIGLKKLVQNLNPQIGHPTLQLSHKSINFGTGSVTTQGKIQLSCHVYYPFLKSIGRVAASGTSVAIIALAVCVIILLLGDAGWLATRLTNANFVTFDAKWFKWFKWLWTDWTVYKPKIADTGFRFVIALPVLIAGVFAYRFFFFKKRGQP